MRLTVYFPEDSPTTHEFVGAKLTVGRLSDNDVQLDDASVSSRHAEIEDRGGRAFLYDLESTNGTFLNGEQVTGENILSEGDVIHFGNVRVVFMEPPARTKPDTAPSQGTVPEPTAGVPASFRPLSPLPRGAAKQRDSLALVAWACFGLGILAALYAVLVTFSL